MKKVDWSSIIWGFLLLVNIALSSYITWDVTKIYYGHLCKQKIEQIEHTCILYGYDEENGTWDRINVKGGQIMCKLPDGSGVIIDGIFRSIELKKASE